MKSEELIRRLAVDATPVRRLPHPFVRTAAWFLASLTFMGALVFVTGLRQDLSARIAEPRFLLELAAAVSTGMMAGAAAFCSTCPGRPLWERLAPFPFLALWLACIGEGCRREIALSGMSALHLDLEVGCIWKIAASSAAPAALIFVMVRRGAPIAPHLTTGLAALAATSLSAAAMLLVHRQDSSVMVLVWQFGPVVALSALAALFGRRLLDWHTLDFGSDGSRRSASLLD
jgi:hypothetical protein